MASTRILAFAACAFTALSLTSAAQAQQTVDVAPFRNIELRGGGHVLLRSGPAQRVTILKGSTQYTRLHSDDGHTLKIDACDARCPMHYDLEIEVVTPAISGVAVDGGGSIDAGSGFAAQNAIDAAISGGGSIDIRSISAGHANAAVEGGGDIKLRAERTLEAAVDGGGDITYWGGAKVTTAIDGGGNVSKGG